MIFDTLKHASIYFSFGEKIKSAFTYLMNTNFENLEPGKYEIDGDDVFAIVQQYDTKPISSGKWEAHKKYLDIQYVVAGKERMGYSNSQKMIVTEEYNEEKDIMFLKGEGNFLNVEAGAFAVFFPTDVHMPGIAINLSTSVKKVVVKVRVEQHVEETQPKEEEISPQI